MKYHAIDVWFRFVTVISKALSPLKRVLVVLGGQMKRQMLILLLSLSFAAHSTRDIDTQKNINSLVKVMECLRNIPDREFTKPDHLVSKELSLMTSVIENITLELGINVDEQVEFRELYKVAYKHCSIVINSLKAEYKTAVSE